jgi:uncharacterized protein
MQIGEYQRLTVRRETPQGLYLGTEESEVLLPRGQIPVGTQINDELEVFVYTDSEDRPVATMKRPHAVVGEFAALRVVAVTSAGAFLDWGIDKDLFCPQREQQDPMREGQIYVVRVYLDDRSNRVVCSSRLNRFLHQTGKGLKDGQQVKIRVVDHYPDYTTVIINDDTRGTLFDDERHEKLAIGELRDAYVKQVREEDRKVAVSLRPQGYAAVLGESQRIMEALRQNGGELPVSDKSSPEEIQRRFGLSKGAFKKLIGTLYREGKIVIGEDRIKLK